MSLVLKCDKFGSDCEKLTDVDLPSPGWVEVTIDRGFTGERTLHFCGAAHAREWLYCNYTPDSCK